jgi:protein gp37
MSDLFHPDIPDEYIITVAEIMKLAKWHTFQVLTKRSQRMAALLSSKLRLAADCPHIWWGVSVEDRSYGLPRIEHLRRAQARVRFLSVEPLLEDIGVIDLSGIDWVIVGGESGVGARPLREEWVVSLRDQCETANVPFFFKQWGGVHKSRTGRTLEGQTYDDHPEIATFPVPTKERRLALAATLGTSFITW